MKSVRLLITAAILLLLAATAQQPAEAALRGRYVIRQAQSSLVMTGAWLPNKTYGAGSPVIIFENENNSNKRYWRIEPVSGNEYKIYWRDTNLLLDLSGGSNRNGVEIILWPDNGGSNQRWRIIKGPHGSMFINAATGLALDLTSDSRTLRNRYQGWERNNTRAQCFSIIPVGNNSGSSSSAASQSSGDRRDFRSVRVRLKLPSNWRAVETRPRRSGDAGTLELYAPDNTSAITITTAFGTNERASAVANQLSREHNGTKPVRHSSDSYSYKFVDSGIETIVIVVENRSARSIMVLSVTNDNSVTEKIINSIETY